MGAGPDPAIHHGKQHTALAQGADHPLAAEARTVGVEEHEIGLGLLYFHARDLRQPPRQRPRIGVIVRQPVDVMVERVNASGGANAARGV